MESRGESRLVQTTNVGANNLLALNLFIEVLSQYPTCMFDPPAYAGGTDLIALVSALTTPSLTVRLLPRSRYALSAGEGARTPKINRPLPQAVLTEPSLTVGLLPRYLHLLYPQSLQKSQPLACSSWPEHSGHLPIIVDMIAPVTCVVLVPCCLPRARAESGWPFKRRLVIMMHSDTACSGEVSRR